MPRGVGRPFRTSTSRSGLCDYKTIRFCRFQPPADGTSLGTEEGHAPPVPTRGRGGAGAEDTRGAAGTMTKRRPETSAGENLSSESILEGRLNLKRRCAERLPEPSEHAARSFGFLIESGG